MLTGPAVAQNKTWKHGLSLFGDLKYAEGFKNFEYVNPQAPQGGVVRQIAFGTFDNFNSVVSGVKGSIAMGTEMSTEALMTDALDEVSAEYGLLAEAVSHPDDFSLGDLPPQRTPRPNGTTASHARTTDDVIFSFDAFKTNSPQLGAYYRPRHQGRKNRRARNHLHGS